MRTNMCSVESRIAVIVVRTLCETGASGHVRASEWDGSCLNLVQCTGACEFDAGLAGC